MRVAHKNKSTFAHCQAGTAGESISAVRPAPDGACIAIRHHIIPDWPYHILLRMQLISAYIH
jgi:hypothetical protein